MNKVDAILAIITDAYKQRRRKPVDYRRMVRACKALELSEDESGQVLRALEYHSAYNVPYPWTQDRKP